MKLALAGDPGALRLVLDRLVPPLRAVEPPVDVGMLVGSLQEQGVAVLSALSEGRVGPDQAATTMNALVQQARLVESEDLAARVAALEKVLAHE